LRGSVSEIRGEGEDRKMKYLYMFFCDNGILYYAKRLKKGWKFGEVKQSWLIEK
jgi:hypothetical protein